MLLPALCGTQVNRAEKAAVNRIKPPDVIIFGTKGTSLPLSLRIQNASFY